ncbi:AAR2 protein-domain-containing protein [Bisporella sp. PMI_857]|nr:AAR2 protein-domain-containing protein [Bisporella sp. PMI_857]
MAQPDPAADVNDSNPGNARPRRVSSPLQSDEAFTVIHGSANYLENRSHEPTNPTLSVAYATGSTDTGLMRNMASFQRSPSARQAPVSALPRTSSAKSVGSCDTRSTIDTISEDAVLQGFTPNKKASRQPSNSSIPLIEPINNYSLTKTPSTKSQSSLKSVASVASIPHLGIYPVGTLRIHEAPPTPKVQVPKVLPACRKTGDIFIVREVPGGTVIGFDTNVFEVKPGETFDGIKCIPAGAHFIWSGTGTQSVRNGFWIVADKLGIDDYGKIYVKYWNRDNECIEEQYVKAEVKIQKDGIEEIFDDLKAFPSDTILEKTPSTPVLASRSSSIWFHMTSSINYPMLCKILPSDRKGCLVSTPDEAYKFDTLKGCHDGTFRFQLERTPNTFSRSAVGRARTEQALDTTAYIRSFIQTNFASSQQAEDIIGEFQFCFITGLHLGNADCMDHWSYILKLFLKSTSLYISHSVLVRKFIETFHAQLIYDEKYSQESIFEYCGKSDIERCLGIYKRRMAECAMEASLGEGERAVREALDYLMGYLSVSGWNLREPDSYVRSGYHQLEDGEFVEAVDESFDSEDDRGEYAPVMVELDESGREKDRISI